MSVMNVSGIDLNQIRALAVLLEERSVTRAAKRLGITQAAASNALARLRLQFDDELLVRAGRDMRLTSRAQELAVMSQEVIRAAERMFQPAESIDPAMMRTTLRVATSDHVELVLLPTVEAILSAEAPGVSLHVSNFGTHVATALRDGEIDLAIAPTYDDVTDIVCEKLLEDRLVWLLRKEHPVARAEVSVEQFARLHHLLVSPRGVAKGPVDDALSRLNLQRPLLRVLPHFAAALLTVSRTDWVTVVPAQLYRNFGEQLGLVQRPVPVPVPLVRIHQSWHKRFDADSTHKYFRQVLRRAAAILEA